MSGMEGEGFSPSSECAAWSDGVGPEKEYHGEPVEPWKIGEAVYWLDREVQDREMNKLRMRD